MFGSDSFDKTLRFMENYHQLRDKVEAKSDLHDKTIASVQEKLKKDHDQVITLDGVKVIIDENSWALVRKSNTEDIIRVSAESNELQKASKILQSTSALVKSCYEEVR